MDYRRSIDKLEKWLTTKGYRLIKGTEKHIEDEMWYEKKIVFLSLRSTLEHQLYSLLHECGHVMIRQKEKTYSARFKTVKESEKNPQKEKTYRYIVEEIEEEIEAWRKGEKLSEKLKLNLNSDIYYKYGSRLVMSYIKLAQIQNKSSNDKK